jgi:CheY-like chemotaxis protein
VVPPTRPLQLLLVDDDRVTAGVLCTMLSDQPVRLTHTLDGSSVLQLLAAQSFDLALVDLRLPFITGWDIVHQMRGAGSTLPIYLISALYTEHDAPRDVIAAAGANGFLPKPIQRAALLELLARHNQPTQPQKITF